MAEEPSAQSAADSEQPAVADSEQPAAAAGEQTASAGGEHPASAGGEQQEPASTAAAAADDDGPPAAEPPAAESEQPAAAGDDDAITMKTLGFDSSDDDDDASSPSVVEAPGSPNVVDEPGSPKVVEKPPTPDGTWPKHLPPPTGACEGANAYKFYHNAYTVMAGATYEHNFLVAGVMLDDRDITKPSAFLVLVEAACPSKGVRLLWFDPELPPHTEYNMTRVGASRLSKNVDTQVRRWVADEDKFQASVDDAQAIDFVVEKFVGITEEDGETRVKARFARA